MKAFNSEKHEEDTLQYEDRILNNLENAYVTSEFGNAFFHSMLPSNEDL